jgi:hypothetical protein
VNFFGAAVGHQNGVGRTGFLGIRVEILLSDSRPSATESITEFWPVYDVYLRTNLRESRLINHSSENPAMALDILATIEDLIAFLNRSDKGFFVQRGRSSVGRATDF